ncbi:MAG: peroxidase family protein [Gemmatimonadota bacterium]
MRPFIATIALSALSACERTLDVLPDLVSCGTELDARPFAEERPDRFLGKVQPATARCRGGSRALADRDSPWTDWSRYWATGDESSKSWLGTKNLRGVNGALVDLEYARVELIRFNLFDNHGTFARYTTGDGTIEGPALKQWREMRLPPGHSQYSHVGGGGEQLCTGPLIRARTLTGICNDIRNPLMGSTGTLFARNVEFGSTFPELGADSLARNRHGVRISVMSPDPFLVSRQFFTRPQSDSAACNGGLGDGSAVSRCDYRAAPFMNVLAAFWIQFMTHDWFSHLDDGRNSTATVPTTGCREAGGRECDSPGIDRALVADSSPPATFAHGGRSLPVRAPRTYRNFTTAWWDASQLYGYDENSRRRVKRDPADRARLLLVDHARSGVQPAVGDSYLPLLTPSDPMRPEWQGQEASAFADNWSIGMSFFHNLFAREHNAFVDEFRRRQQLTPGADCGLRDPALPDRVITYSSITEAELFEAARLVVSALIAKVHTIEWTTQLLYNEPLFRGMNSNWNGLIQSDNVVTRALTTVLGSLSRSSQASKANTWYSLLAAGPGIFGLGSNRADWSVANPDHVNGGVNHFGSPFNFPEEFVTVYRLHPLVPDMIELRNTATPDVVARTVPVVGTFRGRATGALRAEGLPNWALSMGRQRLGLLELRNSPRFLQNLHLERLGPDGRRIDVLALDVLRDRERGVPRYNEFRRQYGLRQITSFDDFIDRRQPEASPERQRQEETVRELRRVYGTHRCMASLVISLAQSNDDGTPVNDCLGQADGSEVDNVEDLDAIVGYLAESVRPHGFAISETQFLVFVLNASRRLFSDRFFTSSFRPEFYTTLGIAWVTNNGPDAQLEPGTVNGHERQPVSPLKRVLLRAMPELATELGPVRNAFDPWARDRGEYYSLAWKARGGAEADASFSPQVRK